jgi:DNA primase
MTLLDLISRETPLNKMANTHGGEYAGACPWCGGADRFRVWPNANKPGYWCRQCDRQGDAIQFLRDYEGLSYWEACERLGHSVDERFRTP